MSKDMRKSQAFKASLYTFSILLVFLIMGTLIMEFFGTNGVEALSKIMGFLLLCVGIQFLINGILDIIVAEGFLGRLVDALNNVK